MFQSENTLRLMYKKVKHFFFVFRTDMKCKRTLDYGERQRCPEYDLVNCETPENPTSCPMLQNRFKSPCYRWICEKVKFLDFTWMF